MYYYTKVIIYYLFQNRHLVIINHNTYLILGIYLIEFNKIVQISKKFKL